MALTKFTKDMEIIAALDDEPNDVGGLSADELKDKFDEGGKALKEYINDTLIPESEARFSTKEELDDVALGQIPDGSLTTEKLADGAVTAEKLADGAVTAEKLAPGVIPDAFTKGETLTPETAALYGEGVAVPDDVFERNAFSIPSKYGVIAFRCTKSDGSPSPFSASISPAVIDGSVLYTNEAGFYVGYAEPGTYKVSLQTSSFVSASPDEMQVTVTSRGVSFIEFKVDPIDHGEMLIESSKTIAVPGALTTTIDIFAVGGGASGGAAVSRTPDNIRASGGGGGYTATLKKLSAAGKILKIQIGAGGTRVSAATEGTGSITGSDSCEGKDGGDTTISLDDSIILTAKGGKAGRGYTSKNATKVPGGDGGSGGAGGLSSDVISANGGSDGSDGLPDDKDSGGGKGQGKTTTKFEENGGTKYSPGGGSVRVDNDSICFEWPGGQDDGSAGKAVYDSSSRPSSVSAIASNTPGAGGGACGLKARNSTIDITARSAAGCKGIVVIRW